VREYCGCAIVVAVSFVVARIAAALLGVGAAIIAFLATAFVVIFIAVNELHTERGRTEWRIQRRRNEARRRQISKKAATIVCHLGSSQQFRDGRLAIRDAGNGDYHIETSQEGTWKTVFIGGRYEGGSPGLEEKYYEPTSGGEYVERTRWVGSGAGEEVIQSYIPGEWQVHLEELFLLAEDARYRKQQRERAEGEAERKKKFGL